MEMNPFDDEFVFNNNFYNVIKDEILCPYCTKILDNPKVCGNCSQPFCDYCINVDPSENCRNCNFKFQSTDTRGIRKFLDKLEFICK
jgi:hypothetical protein